jgi:hypothetical protein
MPEIAVTAEQVDRLGAKLDRFAGELTKEDQRLLITVFGLAAKTLGTVSGSTALPSLSDGLRSTFAPTPAARFTEVGADEGVEVGVTVGWSK